MKQPVLETRSSRVGQLLLAGSICVATGSFASSSTAFTDYARRADVEPLVRTVRVMAPRRQCWDEVVTIRRARGGSHTPQIVGSIVGAVVGNRFGGGSGRDIATISGAVLGGAIGHDYKIRRGRARDLERVVEERCEIYRDSRSEERVEGYRFTYRNRGREQSTRMDQAFGHDIPASASARPLFQDAPAFGETPRPWSHEWAPAIMEPSDKIRPREG